MYEVYTGIGDIKKLGRIKRWQRKSAIKTWMNTTEGRTSVCNMINGTDASQYEPLIDSYDIKMYIFNTDICRLVSLITYCKNNTKIISCLLWLLIMYCMLSRRSVRLYYNRKTNYKGIPAYHFTVRDSFLNEIDPRYGTECFCIDKIANIPSRPNGCLYKGALDLSTCYGMYNLSADLFFFVSFLHCALYAWARFAVEHLNNIAIASLNT